jgi:serine/threonine protein kinase/WD40 repeat protein
MEIGFMDRRDCVTEADLRAFQLGELPDRLGTLVAEHLEACPGCAARAASFDTIVDPCIVQMRQAVGQPSTANRGTNDAATMDAVPCPSELPSETADFPRKFGGYELLGELGRGGMSVVYLARQQRPARTVALKMILAGVHAGVERRTRFLAEADAIGRLQHPHILEIYEVGEHDGQLYLALEWLDAGSLAGLVAGKAQDPTASAVLLEKVARAIHYAHECGIVHRDLKPSNILLQNATPEAAPSLRNVVPKIADFGLAKQEDISLTATNAMVGTPAYMAPEQAAGDKRLVGPACDVYALGAILYEMLTGRPPFQGSTVLETLDQARSTEPTPPEQLQVRVHPDLSSICLKCLHKEPGRRYGSALELAEDLGRFLAGTPTKARRVGSLERTWRWSRRNPMLATTIATVAILLVVIAVGASILSLNLHSALKVSEERTEFAQKAERKATDHLWEAYLATAKSNRLSGRVGQHFESLQAIRKALQLPTPKGHSTEELRTEAIACLVLPDLDLASTWESCPLYFDVLDQDSTLQLGAAVDKDGTVRIRRLKDGSEFAVLPSAGRLLWAGLSFSPDGRFLCHRAQRGQFVWDLAGAQPVKKVSINVADYEHSAVFSADSKCVALVAADAKSIRVYATESGELLKAIHPGFRPDRLAFHPRRNELAVSGGNLLRFFDVSTGAQRGVQLTNSAHIKNFAWHPDGRVLATACDDLKIYLWNADTGALAREPLVGHQNYGMTVKFSGAGNHLVSRDWTGLTRIWDTRTGRQVLALPSGQAQFQPEDRQLLLGTPDNRLRVAPFQSGQGMVCRSLPFCGAGQLGLAFAGPDARFFFVNTSGAMFLIDWARGDLLGQIPVGYCRGIGPEGDKAFLIGGSPGIVRWPVQADAKGDLRVGPPEPLANVRIYDMHGVSADGRVLAIPQYGQGALLWHRPDRKEFLRRGVDVRYCAVSPDGRWVATGDHNGNGVTVWDAQTGANKHDLNLGGIALIGFSPDNRWLLTRCGPFRLWRVGTWEEGPDLHDDQGTWSGWFAFSPDGKTLALTGNLGQIRLLETETGREFARLTVPEQTKVQPCCFSSDGVRLAAVGTESQLLYLWDLRVVRAGLKELDLDWDQPAYPPAAQVAPLAKVEIDFGKPPTK